MSKVVVITGAFQLLHRGHLNLLEKGFELGEVTVLLNSDESILRMKNYLAESYKIRKKALLKTELVERILRIEEDPSVMLSLLRPDYQICGSDHTKEEVRQKGGSFVDKIIILPYTEGVSSSQLYKDRQCQK